MQALVNRAIREFICATYGATAWRDVAREAGHDPAKYDAMLVYEPDCVKELLAAASSVLGKPEQVILEDVGTFLVSGTASGVARRLLRFTGPTFLEFLLSLDELPERVRLALPELEVPPIEVMQTDDGQIGLHCGAGCPGVTDLLAGLVRAMADDYGALVTVERVGPFRTDGSGQLLLSLHDPSFSQDRGFKLAEGFS